MCDCVYASVFVHVFYECVRIIKLVFSCVFSIILRTFTFLFDRFRVNPCQRHLRLSKRVSNKRLDVSVHSGLTVGLAYTDSSCPFPKQGYLSL